MDSLKICFSKTALHSGVARVFPGGRLARQEGQIEEENVEKFRKKWEKIIEE